MGEVGKCPKGVVDGARVLAQLELLAGVPPTAKVSAILVLTTPRGCPASFNILSVSALMVYDELVQLVYAGRWSKV